MTSYDLAEMLLDMENLFIQQWPANHNIHMLEIRHLPYFDQIVNLSIERLDYDESPFA